MKRLYSMLLAVAICCMGNQVMAYDLAVENKDGVTIYYNYINSGKELEVTGDSPNKYYHGILNIPESATFMDVTRPVTRINNKALQACNSDVTLFIPKSITSVEAGLPRSSCPAQGIVVDEDNPVYDSRGGCNAIVETATDKLIVGCLGSTVPEGIKSIGNGAFKELGKFALIVPESVKELGSTVFSGSHLTSIIFCGDIDVPQYTFYNCNDLISVTFTKGLKGIGKNAFMNCNALKAIALGEGLKNIESSAFYNCYNLSSLTFPNSLESIEEEAFAHCARLASLTFPDNMTSIGSKAFFDCSRLESLQLGNGKLEIGNQAFQKCDSLKSLTIPDNVVSIGSRAFEQCNLKTLSLGRGLEKIGSLAFHDSDIYTIYALMQQPIGLFGPDSDYYVFSKNTYYSGTLYVPDGTAEAYGNAEGWKDFSRIKEGIPSSIQVEWYTFPTLNTDTYDLTGRRIAHPTKGIYIQGNRKVVRR